MAATSPRPRSRNTATAALLESLPPAMQDEILSRLPIRDAARTSVLSRAWRRRWEPVPYRFLDWPLGVPGDAVDGVLAHCNCAYPICEFRHPHVPKTDFDRFDQWLLRLAAVGVRSISVEFEITPPRIHMLHFCIFSCRELAILNLVGCDIPAPPPCFAGLPSLTTLSLSKVGFPQGVRGLEALISSSPSLRSLQLEGLIILTVEADGVRVFEQWVINAPNLQRLRIISWYDYGWNFSGLPLLEVADMSGLDSGCYADDRDFFSLISGLDQATKLKLSMPVMDYNMPVEEEIIFAYPQCADDLFSSLTNVCMKDAMCDRNEMLFIKLVLSKASQLEAFNVFLSRHCSKSVEDALAEVLQCKRASPGANVIISSRHHN